ncbi:MAG: hypothetical protein IPG92_14985 [Flavobacteriales bacterium]|nr:hypothetical protein [Flavobacteriales bacterium]
MALQHVRMDQRQPVVWFNGNSMPRLEFRQALFRTPHKGWYHRLYRAALVVTTIAHGPDERKLVVDHPDHALQPALQQHMAGTGLSGRSPGGPTSRSSCGMMHR